MPAESTPTMITLVAAAATTASAVAAAASAFFSSRSSRASARQIDQHERAEQAHMFMAIADRWTRIYRQRNNVLQYNVKSTAEIEAEFPDYRDFLASDMWRQMRPLCNFFETLGVILERNLIDAESLFVLVTVDSFDPVRSGERNYDIETGVLFSRLKGPIRYLREKYRKDIYFYYDGYLLLKYRDYKSNSPEVLLNQKLAKHFRTSGPGGYWSRAAAKNGPWP